MGRQDDIRSDQQDGRSRRAERLRRERRESVARAARTVFAARGYHATRVSDLIASAGIARGTFYLYFGSKRAVFDILLDDFFALLAGEVRPVDVTPGAVRPAEQLERIVERVLGVLASNKDLVAIVLREAVGLDADFDRKLRDFYGRLLAVVSHALETGQRMGIIRPVDTMPTSHCILGSVKEIALLIVDHEAELDTRALTRALVDFNVLGLFLAR